MARAYESFLQAVQCPDDKIDLGHAALAIAHAEYPELDIASYVARLDHLASAVQDRAGSEADPCRIIAALNYTLFNVEDFCGNREDYYDPKNSFLNDVIDRKRGIPITLSVLYMEIARRVGLNLHGVGFPSHFLVKYLGKAEEIVIDPFNRGEVCLLAELESLLNAVYRGKLAFQTEFLSPLSKKQILRRMLNNLKAIYVRGGDLIKALSAVDRLVILEPSAFEEIKDRGLLYLKLECFPQALADLEAYLGMAENAEDADEIRSQIVSLKRRQTRLH